MKINLPMVVIYNLVIFAGHSCVVAFIWVMNEDDDLFYKLYSNAFIIAILSSVLVLIAMVMEISFASAKRVNEDSSIVINSIIAQSILILTAYAGII